MKKLALTVAVIATVLIAGASIAFAALRVDSGSSVPATQRDSSVIIERGVSHLQAVNEMLYPDDQAPNEVVYPDNFTRQERDSYFLVERGTSHPEAIDETLYPDDFTSDSVLLYEDPAFCADNACILP
jgi:hypothetical protein